MEIFITSPIAPTAHGSVHLTPPFDFGKSGLCDVQPEDRVQEFCLLLMARCNGHGFAAGTATVLGSGTWDGPEGPETVLVAATARHCLTNLFKHFGVPEPGQLIPGFGQPLTANPPWTLCGGRDTPEGTALWHSIWHCCGYDDLALIYLRPVNEIARRTTFAQPMISFYSPEVSTELWGFGFGGCRTVEEPTHDFETGLKLTKGQIIQYLDGTRQERWVTDMPFQDGMSGGPVFWRERLVGIISSKMDAANNIRTFVMRIQMLVHFELDAAPVLNGTTHATVQALAEAGIIATLPTCDRADSVVAVPRFGLEVWTRMTTDRKA
ncbi:MAG: hypothetical protein HY986_11500 [Candidatus Melainabacteria bacterium]|nr:hypothetical protein [Candidatus Melainabacteria bacterium]